MMSFLRFHLPLLALYKSSKEQRAPLYCSWRDGIYSDLMTTTPTEFLPSFYRIRGEVNEFMASGRRSFSESTYMGRCRWFILDDESSFLQMPINNILQYSRRQQSTWNYSSFKFLLTQQDRQKCAPLHLNNLDQTIETKRQSRSDSVPPIVCLLRNSVQVVEHSSRRVRSLDTELQVAFALFPASSSA